MNKLIEFNVEGGTVVVESQEAGAGAVVRGGLSQLTEKVGRSLDDTLGVIRPLANAALTNIVGLAVAPESVEIEFSLKFDVRLGAVLASSTTEGGLRIKLVCKPR